LLAQQAILVCADWNLQNHLAVQYGKAIQSNSPTAWVASYHITG